MFSDSALPLVSCTMPTSNRRDFVLQAIKYFQRQDYPNRELIIVDDATQDLSLEMPSDNRIRYVLEPPGLVLGSKRNRACELARGAIIAHWDDDDWYAPSRLTAQVRPILDGSADLTAFGDCKFFDVSRWKFWTCNPSVFSRMYVAGLHAGTLVYSRSLFDGGIRYPHVSLGEDARFLYQCHQRGYRICPLSSDSLFLYVRHPEATWRFACGEFVDAGGWTSAPEPVMPNEDRQFFQAYANRLSP
jgi:glycosyltransferase involved in cell wall biosynthesis